MIQSFADVATENLFQGKDTKGARAFDKALWPVIQRKLDMLNAAHALRDLAAPPSNRLEPLKGEPKGRHSIQVSQQLRITFRFEPGHAHDVRCEDCH